jgi:hypothetical protein
MLQQQQFSVVDVAYGSTTDTARPEITMSALPPKADIRQRHCDVRFVPKADISHFIRLSDRR